MELIQIIFLTILTDSTGSPSIMAPIQSNICISDALCVALHLLWRTLLCIEEDDWMSMYSFQSYGSNGIFSVQFSHPRSSRLIPMVLTAIYLYISPSGQALSP
jgi:hypothetical protein